MKRCERCVMPETVPGIKFDRDGVCNFCLSYKKEVYLGEKELVKIIDSVRKEKNRYDCIVPLSGGRDSSFVLYMAHAVYGLKVLAVHYDNEFGDRQALINMRNACRRLKVKCISIRSKINSAGKIVYYGMRRAVLDRDMRKIINSLCTACSYGYRSVVYRAAEKYKVPLILWGASQSEWAGPAQRTAMNAIETPAGPGHAQTSFRMKCRRGIFSVCHRAFRRLQELEFPVPGNKIPSFPALKNKNIREIRLFDYIAWDRRKIKATIAKELGWEKPPEAPSTWRFDCKLHHFMNYCFIKMFGCSKDCFGYCNMINGGQMDRQEALSQEEKMLATHADGIRELLRNEIGLSEEEVSVIESMPLKSTT